jgi:hypothetical protein
MADIASTTGIPKFTLRIIRKQDDKILRKVIRVKYG